MSDLTDFRDHARDMSRAVHLPECLTRPYPWLKARPAEGCIGCLPDSERVLWIQLANEIDVYLDDKFAGEGSLW